MAAPSGRQFVSATDEKSTSTVLFHAALPVFSNVMLVFVVPITVITLLVSLRRRRGRVAPDSAA